MDIHLQYFYIISDTHIHFRRYLHPYDTQRGKVNIAPPFGQATVKGMFPAALLLDSSNNLFTEVSVLKSAGRENGDLL
jgi:hypothetical protein